MLSHLKTSKMNGEDDVDDIDTSDNDFVYADQIFLIIIPIMNVLLILWIMNDAAAESDLHQRALSGIYKG